MFTGLRLWWLSKQLRSEYVHVRISSVVKLAKLGDARAVEPLMAALKDEDRRVLINAAVGLGQLGDARAIGPLVAALRGLDPYTIKRVAEALIKLGTKRSVKALAIALSDVDSDTRLNVAETLGILGDPRGLEVLTTALSKGNASVVSKAEKALTALDWRPKTIDHRVLWAIIKANRVVTMGVIALPSLIALLEHSCESVRWGAMRALGQLSDVRAVKPLVAALSHADPNMRSLAAKVLGQLGDSRAAAPLMAALRDGDSNVRNSVKRALEELDRNSKSVVQRLADAIAGNNVEELLRLGAIAEKPLIALLDNQQHGEHAAWTLGQFGDARAVGPLLVALTNSDANVRSRAAEALGHVGDARAVGPLLAALIDSNAVVRIRAAEALGHIGDARAIDPLLAALTDSEMALNAAAALVRLGDARGTERLIAALCDSDDSVRRYAAMLLGGLGDARSVLPLILLSQTDEHNSEYAISSLANILKRSAALVDPADLIRICELQGGYSYVEWVSWRGSEGLQRQPLDYSSVKMHARDELSERRIKL